MRLWPVSLTGVVIVAFTADWCSHCRQVEEAYSNVTQRLLEMRVADDANGALPNFYRVDISAPGGSKLAEEYQANPNPTPTCLLYGCLTRSAYIAGQGSAND